jgi:hypothetical protein
MSNGYTNGVAAHTAYSVRGGIAKAIDVLKRETDGQLPTAFQQYLQDVTFTSATDEGQLYFPCPFKETEAVAALKATEASAVAAIADLRFGKQQRKVEVNLEKTAAFLFSTYMATIGGLSKGHPQVKSKLKGARLSYLKCSNHYNFSYHANLPS